MEELERIIDLTIGYNGDESQIYFNNAEEKAYGVKYLIKKGYLVWDYGKKNEFAVEYKKKEK